jgi:hypothetical protein
MGVGDVKLNRLICIKVIERVCIKGVCKRGSVRVWDVVNFNILFFQFS